MVIIKYVSIQVRQAYKLVVLCNRLLVIIFGRAGMNNSSTTLSDTSEMRYQKAVKEISKLVNMNNSVRRDADNAKKLCEGLQEQNRDLFRTCEELNRQKGLLAEQVRALELKIKQLEELNSSLLKQKGSLFTEEMLADLKDKHRLQIQRFDEKVNEQAQTLMGLEDVVAQLQKENKCLNNKIDSLSQELAAEIELKNKKTSVSECPRCPAMNQKLSQANEWAAKVQQQIIELKMGMNRVKPLASQAKDNSIFAYLQSQQVETIRILKQKLARISAENLRCHGKIQSLQAQLKGKKQYRVSKINIQTTNQL